MGVVSQADKDRIFNLRSESLEESFRLLEQIEKDHIRDREKNGMLQNWLTNVFSFVSNAHKSLLVGPSSLPTKIFAVCPLRLQFLPDTRGHNHHLRSNFPPPRLLCHFL